MANPVKGEVEFKAGDRVFTMKLGHNARAEVEGLLGKQFQHVIADLQDKEAVTHETVRGVLWASLHQFHPDLSLFDVGDLMDEVGDDYLSERIGEALVASALPKGAQRPPQKPKRRRAGTSS
jgi:hypothetical protein